MSVTEHNRKVMESLEPGDMVEFPKGIYSHWAIYIGNGEIVHKIKGNPEDECCIRIHDFMSVAKNDKVRRNNSKDKKYRPFTRDEIVKRAMDLAENGESEYDLINHNCEHFASYVRYGKEVSDQVDKAIKIAIGAGAVYCACSVAYNYHKMKKGEQQHATA